MSVRRTCSHQPRRGGDRPDGQEEQPEEVTLQSSNHGTPEPTKGLALEEGGNFNPKDLPRAGQGRFPPCRPQDCLVPLNGTGIMVTLRG